MNKKSLLAIGECMVELSATNEDTLALSFAGDTYNALVYALRWSDAIDGIFYSAVGYDNFSNRLLKIFEQHGISTEALAFSKTRNLGLYSIVNDEHGERQFDYWRDQSAATSMMMLHRAANTQLRQMDMVFFSGIGLGILSDEDKVALLDMIKEQKAGGAIIAFDPNYRSVMWNGSTHAAQWYEKAYELADIGLPGIDDHKAVFGHETTADIASFMHRVKCAEFVIKAGSQGMYCYQDGKQCHHQAFTPAPVQVDTTAAGDSFAGVYLACRLQGLPIATSVDAANAAAGLVVQHRGAIIDSSLFSALAQAHPSSSLLELV